MADSMFLASTRMWGSAAGDAAVSTLPGGGVVAAGGAVPAAGGTEL
jgi:glucokinase